MHDVLIAGDNIQSFTAGGDIKAGQVVGMNTNGKVVAAKDDLVVLGVALYDAAQNDNVLVASLGCIVNVVNADDTAGIDSGVEIKSNANTVGGTVSLASKTLTEDAFEYIVGVTVTAIPGNGVGRAILVPHVAVGPNVTQ